MSKQPWIDYKQIKASISMEMVLAHYGITLRRTNNNLRGSCPLPTHQSDGTRQSFGVNPEKNVWACQSKSCVTARDGRSGGNVIDFVALMEYCSFRDAAIKLHDWFSSPHMKSTPAKPERQLAAQGNNQTEKVNPPLKFQLKDVNPKHSYLEARGITVETATAFGVGYFPGKGSMAGRVVIPILDAAGQLVAYSGRSIDDSEPKYKFPAGFQKSYVLYNLNRATNQSRGVVIVVEGFFDCMKVVQAGFPNTVALMGSSLSAQQEHLLIENFDRVLLMLDGDDAGRKGSEDIAARLSRKLFVRIIEVPSGKQPDGFSAEDLNRILSFKK